MKDVTDFIADKGKDSALEQLLKLRRPVHLPQPAIAQQPTDGLPPICSAASLIAKDIIPPPVLVEGLLHKGSKFVIGGGSKSYKTWCLLDLAMSVASGTTWWGMPTTQGRALYINFEIQDAFFSNRIQKLQEKKGITPEGLQNLDVWNLRGHSADFSELIPKIAERIQGGNYALIVIDPIYKGLGGRDENNAGDIGTLLNEIEKLAGTGAAVAFAAHFSKGNQSRKESIDRIAGSGVFARDPDSILTITSHSQEDVYTVEATLRNFPRLAPFCVRWECPVMVRDENLDPDDLKGVGKKKPTYTSEQLLEVLGFSELTTGEWETKAKKDTGMGERTFAKKKKDLVEGKKVVLENGKWKRVLPGPSRFHVPDRNQAREEEGAVH